MNPELGKRLGFTVFLLGALAVYGGIRLLDSSTVGAILLLVAGLGVCWLGQTIRSISAEVEYERDVLGED